MGRYRSRLEILAAVLGVVKGGAKKTRIMYQANLSYKLLTRYLQDAIEAGLVNVEDGRTYELTEKGSHFLRRFRDYSGRCVEVEEQLSKIENEKTVLENRFLNAESMDAGFKNARAQRKE